MAINSTQKNLGFAATVPMGDWDASIRYNPLNLVRHKTASFYAKTQNQGIEPFVTPGWENVWQVCAFDGDTQLGVSATVLVNQTTGKPAGTVSKTYDTNGNPVFNFVFSGIKGETGESGTSVDIVSGRYYDPSLTYPSNIPTTGLQPLPAFNTTMQGQAYVVEDNEVKGQVDLYFHGVGGKAWTIIDNWGGIPGQQGEQGVGISSITFKETDAQGGNVYNVNLDNGDIAGTITAPIGSNKASQIPNNADLDTYYGADYWGKQYYAAGGNTVLNKPTGVDGFYFTPLRAGTGATVQVITASSDTSGQSYPPNIYIRRQLSPTSSFDSWEQIVTADGSYPTLGAGHADILTEPFVLGTDTATTLSGYVKFAEIELGSTYRNAHLRFEVFDKNTVNVSTTQGCGLHFAVHNITNKIIVSARLLYGNSDYLRRIYVSVPNSLAYPQKISLYYNVTGIGQETVACIKPLFDWRRNASVTKITYITDNVIESELPTETTNTLLSAIYTPVTEAAEANQLSRNVIIYSSSASNIGWWQIGKINVDDIANLSRTSTFSAIMLVNGIYPEAERSGLIELDGRMANGLWVSVNPKIICGSLNDGSRFCADISSDGKYLTFYAETTVQWGRLSFTILDEYYATVRTTYFSLNPEFYGTEAPSNETYAYMSSYAGRANVAEVAQQMDGTWEPCTVSANGHAQFPASFDRFKSYIVQFGYGTTYISFIYCPSRVTANRFNYVTQIYYPNSTYKTLRFEVNADNPNMFIAYLDGSPVDFRAYGDNIPQMRAID